MISKEPETKTDTPEEYELLTIHVRPDLYRAFRRCVWMTIYETGRSQTDIHNEMIEELLRNRQC
jgi:hypothetical protein